MAMSNKLTVQLMVVEGVWNTSDPFERIAPQGLRTGILQELEVDWDDVKSQWHVRGGDDACTWHGYGDSQDEAVLNWLAYRLGVVQ